MTMMLAPSKAVLAGEQGQGRRERDAPREGRRRRTSAEGIGRAARRRGAVVARAPTPADSDVERPRATPADSRQPTPMNRPTPTATPAESSAPRLDSRRRTADGESGRRRRADDASAVGRGARTISRGAAGLRIDLLRAGLDARHGHVHGDPLTSALLAGRPCRR